jgi:hypothetical protein
MPRSALIVTLILALFCAACSTAVEPQPRPASVGHMDIPQKEEYILRTKTTLKTFHATASDLRSRGLPGQLQELGENFDRYVALQVAPIVEDTEASSNLATRMEIAKLQLLCGLTYIELEDHLKVESLLRQLEKHATDPGFISTPLDRGDLGVASIEEGLSRLRESVAARSSGRQ